MLSYGSALLGGSLWLAEEACGFANPANVILVISSAVIVGVIVLAAALSRRGIAVVPSGMGAVLEMVYDFVYEMAVSVMGPVGRRFVPFCMSLFLFIIISNWSGLLPFPAFEALGTEDGHALTVFECPTTKISTTLALAMVSFVGVIFFGMRKYMFGAEERTEEQSSASGEENREEREHSHGDGVVKGFFNWWTHYLHPTPTLWKETKGAMRYLLCPVLAVLFIAINIIEEVARLISLSIRLYGNLYGEHSVKSNLMSSMHDFIDQAMAGGIGAKIGFGIMSLLMWGSTLFVTCLGMLAGFIQAYVFFILTLSYISHVATDEE